ncbi:MAG: hypothetical protein ACM3U1_00810 [Chloroflexota bacterium]
MISILDIHNRFSNDSSANSTLSLYANSYINPFFVSVNYFTIGREYKKDFKIAGYNALADISYNRYGESKFLYGIFSNIRIGMRAGWSSMTPKEPNWGANIKKQFSQNVYFGLSSNSAGLFKNSSLFMQLSMYLPYLNSMTSSNVSWSRQTINQQVSGSLGFDAGNLEFVAASQRGGGFAGRGAANVRFFMDNNNNGEYDANDSELTDYEVSIINVNVLSNKSGGIIRLSNLTPYDRINIKVDESSAKNPLVLPLKKEFSFTSDPNVYQEIDIPCVMGGAFEGRVIYQFAPDSSKAQPGVRLILRCVDAGTEESLAVFSDGSFYKMGVAPGKYELTLDPTQAKILKTRAEPLAITIRNTMEGDYLSGLTLTLYPLEKRAPGGADTK